MPKVRTITLLFTLLFGLSGCFNFGGEETPGKPLPDAVSSTYQNNQFSMTVPSDWEVIDKNDFTKEVPSETVVVFRNNVKNESFTANVNIVKRDLQTTMTSTEYANLVNNRQKSGLVDYKETMKEKIIITVGQQEEETYFTAFEARKNTNEPIIRYQQTYGVGGNAAYIITGAVSEQENENTVQTIRNIVKSFRLK